MLTSHFTAFRATFNPFTRQGKVARLLLSYLPPDARQQMKIQTTVLPKVVPAGVTQGEVAVTFKDGKEIKLNTEKMTIKEVIEELDRHSRILQRKEELSG